MLYRKNLHYPLICSPAASPLLHGSLVHWVSILPWMPLGLRIQGSPRFRFCPHRPRSSFAPKLRQSDWHRGIGRRQPARWLWSYRLHLCRTKWKPVEGWINYVAKVEDEGKEKTRDIDVTTRGKNKNLKYKIDLWSDGNTPPAIRQFAPQRAALQFPSFRVQEECSMSVSLSLLVSYSDAKKVEQFFPLSTSRTYTTR